MKTFLQRIVENFENPIIVTNKRREKIDKGIQIIDNILRGPVHALKQAIPYLKKDKVFVTGCDFPFVTRELANFICNKEAEMSIIKEKELQPLLACYSTSFIKSRIEYVKTLYELQQYAKSIYIIGTYELILNGFSLTQLKNINSWTDLYTNQDKYTLSMYIIK